MNIFKREIKANRKSLLIWSLGLGLMSFFIISIYPSFAQDIAKMDELMEMYPEGLKKVFGLDQLSLADPIGFFATEIYFMVLLFGSIYASILGSSILAKEEDEKTIEFLLAKPVTRVQVLTNKVLSIVVFLVVFNLVISVVTLAGFRIFVTEYYSGQVLLSLLAAPFLVHITFAGLAFLMALFFSRKKSVYSASIGLVLGLYFVNILATIATGVDFLRYLSPFYYMDAASIAMAGGIDILHGLILIGASAAALGCTYFLYSRRDITI